MDNDDAADPAAPAVVARRLSHAFAPAHGNVGCPEDQPRMEASAQLEGLPNVRFLVSVGRLWHQLRSTAQVVAGTFRIASFGTGGAWG